MNVTRRNEPGYADYRANKLVWDRRNHLFRYGVLMDQKMTRFPWLANNYSASQLFRRATGFDPQKGSFMDFTQPRTRKSDDSKRGSKPESALDYFYRMTGVKI